MALDSGIAKMGIFAFSFLVFFGLFIALIPDEFGYTGRTYAQPQNQIPSTWQGISLFGYNFSDYQTFTLNWTSNTNQFDIGGRNLELSGGGAAGLRLDHRYGFGLKGQEYMDWYNSNGQLRSVQLLGMATIYPDAVDEDFENLNNIIYKVQCEGLGGNWLIGYSSYFHVTAIFDFNTTTFDKPSDAWFANDLQLLIGIDPQNANVSLDIWNLISSLLTFNTVQVFGSSGTEVVLLNMAIVAPFWAAIIIFAAAILLELIPF